MQKLTHMLVVYRDDVVFFIFLYQRYIYKMDPTRSMSFLWNLHLQSFFCFQGQWVWRLRRDAWEKGGGGHPGFQQYHPSSWRHSAWGRTVCSSRGSEAQAKIQESQKSWLRKWLAWAFSVAQLTCSVNWGYVLCLVYITLLQEFSWF